MTLPKFIGIGAQKAGTTWLYDMLSQNPSVWLPPLKEVHYFDTLGSPPERKVKRAEHIVKLAEKLERGLVEKGSEGDAAEKAVFLRSLAGNNIMTDDWYRSIFAHPDAAGRISGEITPAYLALNEEQIVKVADLLTDTKFVLLVREPYLRNISQIKMAVGRAKNTPETKDDWERFLGKIKRTLRGGLCDRDPALAEILYARAADDPAFLAAADRSGRAIAANRGFYWRGAFRRLYGADGTGSPDKDVDVPEWVSTELEEMARPSRDYLIEAFGQDFYTRTR